MNRNGKQEAGPIGVVGLGLMGRGIATCLLARGFAVVGYDRASAAGKTCYAHIESALEELVRRRMLARPAARDWRERFRVASSFAGMSGCGFIIESVTEDLKLKQRIFAGLEKVVTPAAVIASNTSSIPISLLQRGCKHPERIIGMHWSEPAEVMRYLEITPGKLTSPETIERTRRLGRLSGKDPAVLNFDIRGFISNRLMYALMREACYLVEAGVADLETVDRSFRNDIGWWATIAGPFRMMDLTGIPAYAAVMEGLLPQLSNSKKVPKVMQDAIRRRARGTSNRKGFYPYTPESARAWEQALVDFTYDVRKLVEKYERRLK
jgi:3-hydroxybutyryl-CoA dehydrogenase